jgi:large subunit ribosomal protein L42
LENFPIFAPHCPKVENRRSKQAKMLRTIIRNFSSKSVNFKVYPRENPVKNHTSVQAIALSKDESCFIAYHPKPEFPYEFSRPIPEATVRQNQSLLKEQALETAYQAFKNKHPEVARQELTKITFTTKHRWFPRSRDKRAKKTPMDREYL